MLLAALVQLNQTSPDVSYTEAAKSIASATIDYLSDANGIIGECCGGCDNPPASSSRAVVMRNLQILQQAAPNEKFATFTQKNADNVWNTARDPTTNQLGSA